MFDGFGMSGAVSMRAGRAGNAFWMCLSASGVRLGGVLGGLGSIFGRFGGPWRVFGEVLWGLGLAHGLDLKF